MTQQFEYMEIDLSTLEATQKINLLGLEGWELVNVDPENPMTMTRKAHLKRVLTDKLEK